VTRLGLAIALVVSGCVSPRTQIIARIDTDMAQGPAADLTAIQVRVFSHDEDEVRFDQRFDLGVGEAPILLPSELGIVPREASSRRVRVEVDAVHDDAVLFTRRSIATFAPGRTLLLEIFLADRCRVPENQLCPVGFTCGLSGCEREEAEILPDLDGAASADAGPVPLEDAGESDAGCALTRCDTSCVDTMTDLAHCGGCDRPCDTRALTTTDCVDGACVYACEAGAHECAGSCVSDTDPATCGASCSPCPAPPANATVTCDGTSCGYVCDSGLVPFGGACVDAPAPRPIAPLSMSRTTKRNPLLSWELPPGAEGARVDICRDPACATIITTFDATGSSASVPMELDVATNPTYHFRLRSLVGGAAGTNVSPVWQFAVAYRSTAVESAWARLLDVNLDGFGDVAVGAPSLAQVMIYGGSATAVSTTPATLNGPAGSDFGASVATAGDVNGDGFGDLVVGSPSSANAFVYYGGASGLADASRTMLSGPAGSRFGASVAALGDVNGDGFGDVAVACPGTNEALVHYGSASGIRTSGATLVSGAAASGFGASVASAMDVNGDALGDLVVGAPLANTATVYLGASAGLDRASAIVLTGPASSAFGTALAAGDVNFDGRGDVVVGAPDLREVHIYPGTASGVATTASWTLSELMPRFGSALAVIDVDNFGYEDVFVGGDGTAVYEYLSNSSGPGVRAGWNLVMSPPAGALAFGAAVASAGNVNGDNFYDLIIGAPLSEDAFVYFGSSSGAGGMTARPNATLGGAVGSGFGAAVAYMLETRRVRART
jgi:hypothetical protein